MTSKYTKWTSASLRIAGGQLRREEIDSELGAHATHWYQKGEPISRRNPKALRPLSIWVLDSPLGSREEMALHLKWLLNFVEPRLDALKRLAEEGEVDFFCGFASESGQGSFTLNHELLRVLGTLPFDLTIDLYPPAAIQSERTAESGEHDEEKP